MINVQITEVEGVSVLSVQLAEDGTHHANAANVTSLVIS